MIIEFFGTLSEQCQKDVTRRGKRLFAITFTVVTLLFGVVPTIICYIQNDYEYFYEFFGLTVLCLIMTVIYWLPINIIRKPPQGVSTEFLIRIEDSFITRSGYNGVQKKSLKKVKKVIDVGEWYYVIFRLGDISNAFVCQKDLIKEGTLEQFEALFEGKIVRKYKY